MDDAACHTRYGGWEIFSSAHQRGWQFHGRCDSYWPGERTGRGSWLPLYATVGTEVVCQAMIVSTASLILSKPRTISRAYIGTRSARVTARSNTVVASDFPRRGPILVCDRTEIAA